MHPKEEGEDALPNFRALGDRPLDAIVISHAHLDHIGTLPVLMRRQPDARIFMTEATAEIGSALLHNSVNVMTRQREEIGVAIYPLFTHKETDRASGSVALVSDAGSPSRSAVNGPARRRSGGLTVEFVDAGHVLGAAGSYSARGRPHGFLHRRRQFRRPDDHARRGFSGVRVDVLIIETTRGDSPLPEGFTRAGGGAASGGGDQARVRARRLRSDAGVRPRQNAGSARR